MKIQTKLLAGILGGMLAVYLLSFLFQQSRNIKEISAFSSKSMSGEEGMQWQWVDRLQFAIRSPLIEFMNAGEMKMFDKTIAAQRNVRGLQEFSLYDAEGKMANSTEVDRKGKVLEPELMRALCQSLKPVKKLTAKSFEIYEPLLVEKSCIKCHESWKEGQVSGVMAMRFSSDALKASEQAWDGFKDDFQKSNLVTSTFTAVGLLIAVGGIVVIAVRYIVSAPIRRTAAMLKDISEGDGDLTKRLEVTSQDEIGDMATSFNTFVEKLQGVVGRIVDNAKTVNASAAQLSAVSSQTAQSVQSVSEKTGAVTTAAENACANTESVAASMEQTSTNLASVSASTEKMSVTVGEIASTSEKARTISGQTTAQATAVSALMKQLGAAAQEIGKVTETIAAISDQTNLLALNATIEAASAGEAGRGFAVVANEIKELARQTAAATENIKAKISGVQASTNNAISGIEAISAVIDDVGALVATIAVSIEEQSSATKDVARNIAAAALGVKDANVRIAQTASVSKSMAQDLTGINAAVTEIRQGGEQVQTSTGELSKVAERLNTTAGQFKV